MTDFSRIFCAVLAVVISVQSISCGTLLYPERRGQSAGRLDVGVVILDTIGLFFFLIPGIIAFTVDFSTGAIYLPSSSLRSSGAPGGMRVVRFDPKTCTPEMLEEIIRRETGKDFHFSDGRLQKVELKDTNEIPVYFAKYKDESSGNLALAE